MQKSDTVNELFTALSKAQGLFSSVKFDKKNPFFNNSKYASLSATQEMYREPLAKNGLALIQSIQTEGEDFYIETVLTHSSGQWLSDRIRLLIEKKSMQGLGSATTYAKRYAAQSLLGICGDDDDDGNAAEPKPRAQSEHNQSTEKQLPKDIIMPFGKSKGKRLGEIDLDTLQTAAAWLSAEIKKDPKPKNVKQMQFIYGQIKTLLASQPKDEAPPADQFAPDIPEIDPQQFPIDDLDLGLSNQPDPADYVISVIKIGNLITHNKKISSFTEKQLRDMMAICNNEVKSEKSIYDKAQMYQVWLNAKLFLESVGVSV